MARYLCMQLSLMLVLLDMCLSLASFDGVFVIVQFLHLQPSMQYCHVMMFIYRDYAAFGMHVRMYIQYVIHPSLSFTQVLCQ